MRDDSCTKLYDCFYACFFVHSTIESGLPLLNPYKDQNANFRYGANFAVVGATALSTEIMAEKKIVIGLTNSSLNVQLDWMSSHFKTTCSTDCQAKLKKSLFLAGEVGGNEFNYGLLQGKTMNELRNMVPEVVQTIIQGVKFQAVRRLEHAGRHFWSILGLLDIRIGLFEAACRNDIWIGLHVAAILGQAACRITLGPKEPLQSLYIPSERS
ncbi:acetylajmalan esterase-like isoform X2 [Nicotiana sylvestris]|uniref:Acetylajmalan esterase-like isoform X2 n=1 Tax=Nicotiana sylvestris TaxID=4096 RepID=A0A1U7VZE1_NICSY|nr:PREDICTED: acetylajmalan esterase-like isoform X2 [Nicotiana sylvestris]